MVTDTRATLRLKPVLTHWSPHSWTRRIASIFHGLDFAKCVSARKFSVHSVGMFDGLNPLQ